MSETLQKLNKILDDYIKDTLYWHNNIKTQSHTTLTFCT